MQDPVVIVSAARTPIGAFQGAFAGLSASELGGIAIRGALERCGGATAEVDEVLMGNCLMAGQGQAPARQAVFKAGLPSRTGAVTLSKMCGSGMKATMLAHAMLVAGDCRVVVAGGMESMTNAPYLLPKARGGYRMGHGQVLDHMMLDGLEDAYQPGRSMGTFGEDCAEKYGFTREAQDAFAIASVMRARHAIESGAFAHEIVPVSVSGRSGSRLVDMDEEPSRAKPEKAASLKPAFREGGTITAASSSSISDGAAAMVMARQSTAVQMGWKPLARIVAHRFHAQEPEWFSTAPVGAARKVLAAANWRVEDVDLWEVNEAFAVVPMALMSELAVPHDRVNVHGGACALGHPIGASGARVIVTLLNALRVRGFKRGVATLCLGGGEATAMAVELL
jgi:acetyl-CoA C-acetyltransferase